jgi:hypothetical protein
VAFYLSVPTTSLVSWSFSGMSWNFYLHLHEGGCTGTEVLCQTYPSGGTSLMQILDPGFYFLILDAPNIVSTGSYSITTTTTPVVRVSGNDTCSSAETVTSGRTYAGSLAGLADDTMASCGWVSGGADAVFRVNLTTGATLEASTVGTTFDTIIYVLDSTCTGSTTLPCDDNGGGGVASRIYSYLSAGTYYIVLDDNTWGATGTDYVMTVNII